MRRAGERLARQIHLAALIQKRRALGGGGRRLKVEQEKCNQDQGNDCWLCERLHRLFCNLQLVGKLLVRTVKLFCFVTGDGIRAGGSRNVRPGTVQVVGSLQRPTAPLDGDGLGDAHHRRSDVNWEVTKAGVAQPVSGTASNQVRAEREKIAGRWQTRNRHVGIAAIRGRDLEKDLCARLSSTIYRDVGGTIEDWRVGVHYRHRETARHTLTTASIRDDAGHQICPGLKKTAGSRREVDYQRIAALRLGGTAETDRRARQPRAGDGDIARTTGNDGRLR